MWPLPSERRGATRATSVPIAISAQPPKQLREEGNCKRRHGRRRSSDQLIRRRKRQQPAFLRESPSGFEAGALPFKSRVRHYRWVRISAILCSGKLLAARVVPVSEGVHAHRFMCLAGVAKLFHAKDMPPTPVDALSSPAAAAPEVFCAASLHMFCLRGNSGLQNAAPRPSVNVGHSVLDPAQAELWTAGCLIAWLAPVRGLASVSL